MKEELGEAISLLRSPRDPNCSEGKEKSISRLWGLSVCLDDSVIECSMGEERPDIALRDASLPPRTCVSPGCLKKSKNSHALLGSG